MSKVWFSADSHFGHKNIINYCDRPFDSVDEMDAELIENWNEVVAPEDDVYYLGDFSLDFRRVRQVVPLLRGKIHLVAGNHDLCHSSHSSSSVYSQRYKDAGFTTVSQNGILEIAGERVLCNHLPYYSLDDPDTRYQELKPNDEGQWLLHGHVHQRWKIKNRQINVGVDVWDFYPVGLDAVIDLIECESSENENWHSSLSIS